MKKVILKESQVKMLINEGLSKRLFHFTSLERGARICKSDMLLLQPSFAKRAEEDYVKKDYFYLSCTRRRDVRVGYSSKYAYWGGVRIEFDGEKLGYNFRGRPLNYWNGLGDKFHHSKANSLSNDDLLGSYEVRKFIKANPNASQEEIMDYANNNFNNSAQYDSGDESEDRVFFKKSILYNLHRYINRIDVLVPKDRFSPQEIGNFYSLFKGAKGELQLLVHVYDDVNEFNKPNGRELEYEDIGDNYAFSPKINAENENVDALLVSAILSFITYADPKYEGNAFYANVRELLLKYGLDAYVEDLDYFRRQRDKMFSVRSAFEELYSSMTNYVANRDGSKDKSMALQMLSDYMKSLGVYKLRDLYNAKIMEIDNVRQR